jgi:hypothetical protein
MILLKGCNVTRDGFSDVGNGLFTCAALANATGKTGTFGDPVPVIAGVNDDLAHAKSLQIVLLIYGSSEE